MRAHGFRAAPPRMTRRRSLAIAFAVGVAATFHWPERHSALAQAAPPPDSPDAVLAMLRDGHPRLILTSDALDGLRPQIESDPVLQGYRDALVRRGEQILGQA